MREFHFVEKRSWHIRFSRRSNLQEEPDFLKREESLTEGFFCLARLEIPQSKCSWNDLCGTSTQRWSAPCGLETLCTGSVEIHSLPKHKVTIFCSHGSNMLRLWCLLFESRSFRTSCCMLLQRDGESQRFWEVPHVFIAATFALPSQDTHV